MHNCHDGICITIIFQHQPLNSVHSASGILMKGPIFMIHFKCSPKEKCLQTCKLNHIAEIIHFYF